MFTDGILRYFWTVSLFAACNGDKGTQWANFKAMSGISWFAEAYRRAQWALIRVELEQYHNFEIYRTINIVPPVTSRLRERDDEGN